MTVTVVLRNNQHDDGAETSVERKSFEAQLLEDVKRYVGAKPFAAYELRVGFGYSYGRIARLFGVSKTSAWRWVSLVEDAINMVEKRYSRSSAASRTRLID
jgi:hypothetical protein